MFSVYVTNSADASASFSSSIVYLTSNPPYSATSLKGSTSPVPIQTSGGSSSSGNGPRPANGASGVTLDKDIVLMGAAMAAVFALALGL